VSPKKAKPGEPAGPNRYLRGQRIQPVPIEGGETAADLIDRNAERYAREADLRFSLGRVNEHIDAISLASGEAGEARRLKLDLAAVLAAMRALVIGHTNLTWVTAGYGWLTLPS
jgi:ABC-type uncharacterized transport system fused permease/ATPase subunit